MNLFNQVLTLVSRLPPEGAKLLAQLVKILLGSRDPMAGLRAAKAAAAKEAYRKGAVGIVKGAKAARK